MRDWGFWGSVACMYSRIREEDGVMGWLGFGA
jgi:hypothetical protein